MKVRPLWSCMVPADLNRLRFGVLTKGASTKSGWDTLIARVEAAGFDTLLIPDHLDPQFGFSAAIAYAAGRSSELRFGTLVLNLDLRHPPFVAAEAVTLAVLTGSRFELGVGAGWKQRDYELARIAFPSGAARFARFEQHYHRLWDSVVCAAGGQVTSPVGESGRFEIRALIGAGGSHMLRFAAHHADIVSITRRASTIGSSRAGGIDISLASVRRKTDLVRGAAAAAGRQVTLNCLLTSVVIGAEASRALDRQCSSSGLDRSVVRESPELLFAASTSEAVELLAQRIENTGITYFAVPESGLDSFVPVLARLR